jgi:hypothetical protein
MPIISSDRLVKTLSNENYEKYLCSFCHGVLINPVQNSTCHHRYCLDCFENSHWTNCPDGECPLTLTDIVPVDLEFKNRLENQWVMCMYHGNGCERVHKLKDLNSLTQHYGSCDLKPLFICKDCGFNNSEHDCVVILKLRLRNAIVYKNRWKTFAIFLSAIIVSFIVFISWRLKTSKVIF